MMKLPCNEMMQLFAIMFILIERCYATCNKPLGIEDGRIKDKQLTSLYWLYHKEIFNKYYQPKFARLNNKKLGGGGWCSENNAKNPGAYFEIDLLKNTKLTALATQGRGIGSEYIDEFGITYKRENDTLYREYRERGRWHIFTGNNDSTTVVKNEFKHPIVARIIRIVPLGDLFMIYCGRFEIYGCEWRKKEDHLISYQLPIADEMQGMKTTDNIFDGTTSKLLSFKGAGLGKLTDDEDGTLPIGNSLSSKWIAYKKKAKFSPFFQFNFGTKRRFSAIKFHMLNKGNNIKVFLRVQVLFSNDGKMFDRKKNYLTTAAERLSSGAFVITVPLDRVVAKHIKCIFTQPREWMLISEVDFASASPNAPLPTRPARITKKPAVVINEELTTREELETVTTRATPRLLFSLPAAVTIRNININKKGSVTKAPSDNDVEKSDEHKAILLDPPSSNPSQKNGSLSFPIIIAIVLGAIVISVIISVLVIRQIRSMDKDRRGRQPKTSDQKPSAPPQHQGPEFRELLITEIQGQPVVAFKSPIHATEFSKKLILDSGYTSHGSAGGSVREVPVTNLNGSPV